MARKAVPEKVADGFVKRALPCRPLDNLSRDEVKFVLFAALISLSVTLRQIRNSPIFTARFPVGRCPRGMIGGWYSLKRVLKIKIPEQKGSTLDEVFEDFVAEFDFVSAKGRGQRVRS